MFMKQLVIVESPTKAKTIGKFLGNDYEIKFSMGHVMDLPKSKLGVDLEHDFAPQYVIPRLKQKHVTALKKLAAKADHILFATDEDRDKLTYSISDSRFKQEDNVFTWQPITQARALMM